MRGSRKCTAILLSTRVRRRRIEVLELIGQIQAIARKERGIELETEVQIVGEDATSMMRLAHRQTHCVLKGGPGAERACSPSPPAPVAKALRSLGAKVTEVDVEDASFSLPNDTEVAFHRPARHFRRGRTVATNSAGSRRALHWRRSGREPPGFRQNSVERKIQPARRRYTALGSHSRWPAAELSSCPTSSRRRGRDRPSGFTS